ncbi:hypothetical protein GCM10017589_28660 [Streptomyces poonensis]|nr:hypothetical protein GCM10017589_28660 [Streptomyces poonensis]
MRSRLAAGALVPVFDVLATAALLDDVVGSRLFRRAAHVRAFRERPAPGGGGHGGWERTPGVGNGFPMGRGTGSAGRETGTAHGSGSLGVGG